MSIACAEIFRFLVRKLEPSMSDPREVRRQLVLTLPTDPDDIEEQARAVLRLVLDPTSAHAGSALPANPCACPNCDDAASSTRTPYCSEACREAAAFVRQVRAGLMDGAILEQQRQLAFGQVLWYLLGGGRPLRVHLIPERARLQVKSRAGDRCQLCGAPASTVDHIRTGCNRTINLRAVCDACNRSKPFGDVTVLKQPTAASTLSELSARIGSEFPLRCCDDAATWDWRAFLDERLAALSPP